MVCIAYRLGNEHGHKQSKEGISTRDTITLWAGSIDAQQDRQESKDRVRKECVMHYYKSKAYDNTMCYYAMARSKEDNKGHEYYFFDTTFKEWLMCLGLFASTECKGLIEVSELEVVIALGNEALRPIVRKSLVEMYKSVKRKV